MKARNISTIGRALDPQNPTNRAIATTTLAVAAGGAAWRWLRGAAPIPGLLWGVRAGFTIFITWALCRELDPDHPEAALVAAGLILPVIFLRDLSRLTTVLWLVVLARVVNHIVGLSAGLLDVLGLAGIAAWLSLQGNWGYGMITSLALILDGWLPDGKNRQHWFGLMTLIATLIIALVCENSLVPSDGYVRSGLFAFAISIGFVPVIIASSSMDSLGDVSREPLIPARVQAAQLIAVLVGLETALVEGTRGVLQLGPLWAAFLGSSLTWAVTRPAD